MPYEPRDTTVKTAQP